MTSDQYTQLIDFLGGKFERIDHRFEEAKRERGEIREEAKREREEIRAEGKRERGEIREEAKRERQKMHDEARREREKMHDEARRERERMHEEARRHAVVLFEQSQASLNTVGEGLGVRMAKLEETVAELNETVRRGFADHEGRIQVLERAGSDPED